MNAVCNSDVPCLNAAFEGAPVKTVFFLDDSQELLEVMKVFAETSCNSQAILASNFDDMFTQAEAILKCDMAFIDINLGIHQPSGVQAYRWMRSLGYNKAVFFLTGHSVDSEEAREALTFDKAKVLRKPIPAQDLIQLIGSQHD